MKTYIEYTCDFCSQNFKKEIRQTHSKTNKKFCSKLCKSESQKLTKSVICLNCNTSFEKQLAQFKKSPNHFCSKSCAATYNNKHKSKGNRRSKLEKHLEEQLTLLYPSLEVHYNQKSAINSELDIYIPSLRLAFELNGIFHCEPIFGQDKLNQIKKNDENKFKACYDNNITLCMIDTSKQKYFKEQTSKEFLDIIIYHINWVNLLANLPK